MVTRRWNGRIPCNTMPVLRQVFGEIWSWLISMLTWNVRKICCWTLMWLPLPDSLLTRRTWDQLIIKVLKPVCALTWLMIVLGIWRGTWRLPRLIIRTRSGNCLLPWKKWTRKRWSPPIPRGIPRCSVCTRRDVPKVPWWWYVLWGSTRLPVTRFISRKTVRWLTSMTWTIKWKWEMRTRNSKGMSRRISTGKGLIFICYSITSTGLRFTIPRWPRRWKEPTRYITRINVCCTTDGKKRGMSPCSGV